MVGIGDGVGRGLATLLQAIANNVAQARNSVLPRPFLIAFGITLRWSGKFEQVAKRESRS